MLKKLNTMNVISAALFFVSSVSLLFIPWLKTGNGASKASYMIALFFWIGLLCGIALQICLIIKCKELKKNKNTKKQRLPLFIAAVSFLFLMILVIIKSNNSFMVVGALACTLLSLQSASIIKRKECLK